MAFNLNLQHISVWTSHISSVNLLLVATILDSAKESSFSCSFPTQEEIFLGRLPSVNGALKVIPSCKGL